MVGEVGHWARFLLTRLPGALHRSHRRRGHLNELAVVTTKVTPHRGHSVFQTVNDVSLPVWLVYGRVSTNRYSCPSQSITSPASGTFSPLSRSDASLSAQDLRGTKPPPPSRWLCPPKVSRDILSVMSLECPSAKRCPSIRFRISLPSKSKGLEQRRDGIPRGHRRLFRKPFFAPRKTVWRSARRTHGETHRWQRRVYC